MRHHILGGEGLGLLAGTLAVSRVKLASFMKTRGAASKVTADKPVQRVRRAAAGAVESLESRQLLSSTYFVAPYGSDTNAGTLAEPFKTIGRAASIAVAGDHVEIRAGTYHETVIPKHSGTASAPIVFEAYNGESVTVSGADPVTGWSDSSGSIYDASMSWDLGEGNNEVFVNGTMINEARFPNTSLDPSHPTLDAAQKIVAGSSSATIYDSRLNQPANYWKGAVIHIAPGQEWVAQTGTVTASSPGQLTFSYSKIDSSSVPENGSPFYLTGTFKALDTSGEWYRDPSTGKLYLWTPTSNNPANDDIEVKHRAYAFDVSGVHDITIQNINIFAATINSNSASSDLKINHINAQYISQFVKMTNGWSVPNNTGIVLDGANSILENSTIADSAGDGVYVGAGGVQITNNLIRDVDYNAGDAAAIRVAHSNVNIEHNTIYNTGRDGIRHAASGVNILYNTIHDIGLQTTEAGATYTVGVNGGGSVIAYNTISNVRSGGFGGTGIFLDNNSSGFVIHDNIVSNCDSALKLNYICRNNNIYNNTLSGTYAVNSNQKGDWSGTHLTNNVFLGKVVTTGGASSSSNVSAKTSGHGAGGFTSGVSTAILNAAPPPPPTPPTPTPPATSAPTPPSTPATRSATTAITALKWDAESGVAFDNYKGVGYADNGDWLEYKQINFGTGIQSFVAEVAALAGQAGSIQLRLDSTTGTLIGTLKVASTGAWNNYTQQIAAVTGATGTHNLFLVFQGGTGVANIESFNFSTTSAARPATSTVTALQWSAESGVAWDNYNGVGYTSNGDWVQYNQINFGTGVSTFKAQVAALPGVTGSIQLRLDSPTGTLVGTLKVSSTGAWNKYVTQTAAVKGATGIHNLYLVFVGTGTNANVESFSFA